MWPLHPESLAAIAVGGGHGARMTSAVMSCIVGAMGRLCGSTAVDGDFFNTKTGAKLLLLAQGCAGSGNIACW
jgi:hypothetical protein